MKWVTHQTVAGVAALALDMPWPAVAGALFGAVLPDVIDQRLARLSSRPQKAFNRLHRGASHWLGWYVLLWLGLLALPLLLPPPFRQLSPAMQATLSGVAFGALSHVALDMLTPSGVPLTPFSRRNKLSLGLCSTGSVQEYLFLAVALLVMLPVALERSPELMRILRRIW